MAGIRAAEDDKLLSRTFYRSRIRRLPWPSESLDVNTPLPSLASITSCTDISTGETASDDAAKWLCLAVVALPFLQTLPWDFDRVAPLDLVSVALWSGRGALT